MSQKGKEKGRVKKLLLYPQHLLPGDLLLLPRNEALQNLLLLLLFLLVMMEDHLPALLFLVSETVPNRQRPQEQNPHGRPLRADIDLHDLQLLAAENVMFRLSRSSTKKNLRVMFWPKRILLIFPYANNINAPFQKSIQLKSH